MPEDIGVMNREGERTFTQPARSEDSPGAPIGVVLGAGLVGVDHARAMRSVTCADRITEPRSLNARMRSPSRCRAPRRPCW